MKESNNYVTIKAWKTDHMSVQELKSILLLDIT